MDIFPGDLSLGRVASVYQDTNSGDGSSIRGGALTNQDAFFDLCNEACTRPHVVARESSKLQFETALASYNILSAVHPGILRELASHVEFRTYKTDSVVSKSGDSSRGMYIIIEGGCIASIAEHTLTTSSYKAYTLNRGSSFYEMSMFPSLAALSSVPALSSSHIVLRYLESIMLYTKKQGLVSAAQALAGLQDTATSCGMTPTCICNNPDCIKCIDAQFYKHPLFKAPLSRTASPYTLTATSPVAVLYISSSSMYQCIASHIRRILTSRITLMQNIPSFTPYSQHQQSIIACTSVQKCLAYKDMISNSSVQLQGTVERYCQPLETPQNLSFPKQTPISDLEDQGNAKKEYLQPYYYTPKRDQQHSVCILDTTSPYLCTNNPVLGNSVCISGYNAGDCISMSSQKPGLQKLPVNNQAFVTSQNALVLELHPLLAVQLWDHVFAADSLRTEIFTSIPGLRPVQISAALLHLPQLDAYNVELYSKMKEYKDLLKYIHAPLHNIAGAAMLYQNSFYSTLHTSHSKDSGKPLISCYQFAKWLHLSQPVCIPSLRMTHKHKDIAGYIVLEGELSLLQNVHSKSTVLSIGYNSHGSSLGFVVKDTHGALQSEYMQSYQEQVAKSMNEEGISQDSHALPKNVDFHISDHPSLGECIVLQHVSRGAVIGVEHALFHVSLHEHVHIINLSSKNAVLLPLNQTQMECLAAHAEDTQDICDFIQEKFPFGVNNHTLASLALSCTQKRYMASQVLLDQKEVPRELQFLRSGKVAALLYTQNTHNGRALRPLHIKLQSDRGVVGQAGLLDSSVYMSHLSLTYTTVGLVKACVLPIYLLKCILSSKEYHALLQSVWYNENKSMNNAGGNSVPNSPPRQLQLTMNLPKVGSLSNTSGTKVSRNSKKIPTTVSKSNIKKTKKTQFALQDKDQPFLPVQHLPTDPYARFRVLSKNADFYIHALKKKAEIKQKLKEANFQKYGMVETGVVATKSSPLVVHVQEPDGNVAHTILSSMDTVPDIVRGQCAVDSTWMLAVNQVSRLGPVLGQSTATAIQMIKTQCIHRNLSAEHAVSGKHASFAMQLPTRPIPVQQQCYTGYIGNCGDHDTRELVWLQDTTWRDAIVFPHIVSKQWKKVRVPDIICSSMWLHWQYQQYPDTRQCKYYIGGVAQSFQGKRGTFIDTYPYYSTQQMSSVVQIEPLVIRYKPQLPKDALCSSADHGVCFVNTELYGYDAWYRRVQRPQEQYIVQDQTGDEFRRFHVLFQKETQMMNSHIARNRWKALLVALRIHAKRVILIQQQYAYFIQLHEQVRHVVQPQTNEPQDYIKAMLLVLSARVGFYFEKQSLVQDEEEEDHFQMNNTSIDHHIDQSNRSTSYMSNTPNSNRKSIKPNSTNSSPRSSESLNPSITPVTPHVVVKSNAYNTRKTLLDDIFTYNKPVMNTPSKRSQVTKKSAVYAENAARQNSVIGQTVLEIDQAFLEEHLQYTGEKNQTALQYTGEAGNTGKSVVLSTQESADLQRQLNGKRLVSMHGVLEHTGNFSAGRNVAQSAVDLAKQRRKSVLRLTKVTSHKIVQEQLQRLYYAQAQGGVYTFKSLDASTSICREYSAVSQHTVTSDLLSTLRSVISCFPGSISTSKVEKDNTLDILKNMLPSYITRSQSKADHYEHHNLSTPKLSSHILEIFAPPESDTHLRMWMNSELKEPSLSTKFKHIHRKILEQPTLTNASKHVYTKTNANISEQIQTMTQNIPVYQYTDKNNQIHLHKKPDSLSSEIAQQKVINDANGIKAKRIQDTKYKYLKEQL